LGVYFCQAGAAKYLAVPPNSSSTGTLLNPMTPLFRSLTLSAIGLGSLVGLSAQTGDPSPGEPRRFIIRFGHPIIHALDADKDRVLSATEIANAPSALKTLDANSDGTLSADELHPPRPADLPPPPAGLAVRFLKHAPGKDVVMLALDANSDGGLSAEEMANAAASLKALDVSGDGQLTIDEFGPPPPEAGAAKHR
jgi:hypothetical protein